MKDDLTAFWYCNRKIFRDATGFSVVFWMVVLSVNVPNIALVLIAVIMILFIAAVCSQKAQTNTVGDEIKKEIFDMWHELEPRWSLDAAGVISISIFITVMVVGLLFKNKALPALATFFS